MSVAAPKIARTLPEMAGEGNRLARVKMLITPNALNLKEPLARVDCAAEAPSFMNGADEMENERWS